MDYLLFIYSISRLPFTNGFPINELNYDLKVFFLFLKQNYYFGVILSATKHFPTE